MNTINDPASMVASQDDDAQDGVARIPNEEAGINDAQQREEEDQYGQFEDDGDGEHDIHKEVEVLGDRDHRRDVDVAPDSQQEGEAETEGDEVGKKSAGNEKAGGADHKGSRPFALFLVEAGCDEAPNLVKDPRRREEQGGNQRKLDVDHIEGLHRRDLGKIRRVDTQFD
ncbi:MAG: hypothetical protein U5J83_03770 [Bryobacterales bacterium]|nr:hypothetical protein [Bryobacterales bacterium]